MKNLLLLISILTLSFPVAQEKYDLYDIIDNVSSNRIERDIKTLVNFGTRHTLSDTISKKRGIGAARRWIKSEFEARGYSWVCQSRRAKWVVLQST